MKIRLLLLMTIIGIKTLIAQQSFCPPGAKWHFSTKALAGGNPQFHDVVYNYKAWSDGKTKIDGDSVSVLKHEHFFIYCGTGVTTYIKENNNVVLFMNSYTANKWQTLFDFNAAKYQTWTDTLYLAYPSLTEKLIVQVRVDSSFTILDNSKTLTRLNLHYEASKNDWMGTSTYSYNSSATQLYGGQHAIFNFDDGSSGFCDADYFQTMLCYEDPAFGLKQFSSLPCGYSNLAGISEKSGERIEISPNPANGLTTITLPPGNNDVVLFDLTGRHISGASTTTGELKLDLSGSLVGLYFVKTKTENGQTIIQKLIIAK